MQNEETKKILLVVGSISILTGCGSDSQQIMENNQQNDSNQTIENHQPKGETVTEGEIEMTYDQTSIDLLTKFFPVR